MKFWPCLVAASLCVWLSTPALADTIATFSVDVTFPVVAGLELTGTFDWNLTSNTVNPDFTLTDFSVSPLEPNDRTFPFVITRTVITAFSPTPSPGVEEFLFVHDYGAPYSNDFRNSVSFVIPFDPAAALVPGQTFPLLSALQTNLPFDSAFGTCEPTGNCSEDGLAPAGSTIELTAVTTTPLPAALPLFASGLAGLGWFANRRRKHAAA